MKVCNPYSSYCCPAIYFNLSPNKKGSDYVIRKNGEIYYEENYIEDYTLFDFRKDFQKGTYLENIKKPTIFLNGGFVTSFEYLNSLRKIKNLNLDSLDVYFMEMLVIVKNGKISNEILDSDDRSTLSFPELDAILELLKNNNIKTLNVYLCESDFNKHFENLYQDFNITYYDSWTRSLYNSCFKANLPKNIEVDKKFSCFNLRNDLHKDIILNFLYNKDSYYSRGENFNDINLLTVMKQIKSTNKDYYLKILCGYGNLKDKIIFLSNYSSDIRKTTNKHYVETIMKPLSISQPTFYLSKSFCFIDSESRFFNIFPYFSEKIYTPIVCHRPFILASTPGSLALLKKEGFKTFDYWWDESYDKETDHVKRLVKIMDLIEYIDSFSLSELKEMLRDMEPVLQHNYKFAKEYSKSGPS